MKLVGEGTENTLKRPLRPLTHKFHSLDHNRQINCGSDLQVQIRAESVIIVWILNKKKRLDYMRMLFQLLEETLKKGEDTVLVTIVASSGSTPRGDGARMLVTRAGRIGGTIGGGAVEYRSEEVALEVLRTKDSHMEHFCLKPNEVQDLGMICGGDVNVFFQYISADEPQNAALMQHIEALYQTGEEFWMVNDITSGEDGGIAVYARTGGVVGCPVPEEVISGLSEKPAQIEKDGRIYYCEKLLKSDRVYIFGGGHVSQALVSVLKGVDFRCVVLEDRPEFCQKTLFPGAEEVLMIENSHIGDYVTIQASDYVCIMTRGHKDDLTVQAQVLKTPAGYIGVIGSRHKKAGVFAKLKEMGFSDTDLERITSPIGLSIGAETPEEIAISIAAQLIERRANAK